MCKILKYNKTWWNDDKLSIYWNPKWNRKLTGYHVSLIMCSTVRLRKVTNLTWSVFELVVFMWILKVWTTILLDYLWLYVWVNYCWQSCLSIFYLYNSKPWNIEKIVSWGLDVRFHHGFVIKCWYNQNVMNLSLCMKSIVILFLFFQNLQIFIFSIQHFLIHNLYVKQFESQNNKGPPFYGASSGSKLFAKVNSKGFKNLL